MPAPTNISFATATDVGDLPASISQNVRFGGVNYTVYYKITPSFSGVLGVYGKGDPFSTVNYHPRVIVYDQTDSLLNIYLSLDADNIPLQMPVVAGTTYYFYCLSTTGNTPTTAVLDLSVLRFQPVTTEVGDLAITDDNTGFPLAILSQDDGSVRRFVHPFPGGEQGIVLPNGKLLVEDIDTGGVVLYSPQLQVIATPTYTPSGNLTISSNQDDTFYVGDAANTVKTISDAGVVGATTWTIGSAPFAMAPNLGGTILYYADRVNSAVHRWNLTVSGALSDLAAALASYQVNDILNLQDGTFLVSYQKNTATKKFKVLRYNAAGSVLNTFDFGANIATFDQRICQGIDDPVSFWTWIHQDSPAGVSAFIHTTISTGIASATLSAVTYESGMYAATAAEFPLARFGHANSCPIMLLRAVTAAPTTYTTTRHPIRWLRRFPLGTNENKRLFVQRLEIIMQQGLGTSTGQGSDPQMMMRFSKDGGKTWGAERLMSTGKMGDYEHRSFLHLLGSARAPVVELSGTDPAPMYFCKALADIESGSH